MEDKLEEFISSNREAFDVDPPKEIWSKINTQLRVKNDGWIISKWLTKYTIFGFSASVLLITLTIYYLNKPTPNIQKNDLSNYIKPNVLNSNEVIDNAELESENHNNTKLSLIIINNDGKANSDLVLIADTNIIKSITNTEALPQYTEPIVFNNSNVITQTLNDSTYIFPKLNEKEIKANNKQKKKIIETLYKLNKKEYAQIPQKSNYYQSPFKENENVYMLTHEVTNLEYRTFLFDLLINNEKELFIKAKPSQSLWLNCIGQNTFNGYKESYFSAKEFNQYPVVNISFEGAELFCKWLEKNVNEFAFNKNEKNDMFTVNLPTTHEWQYCAKGGLNGSYPWGNDSIQNKKNVFLANFCAQKSKDKFRTPIVYPFKTNPQSYTTGGYALNNDTIASVLVFAYNPNNYGLYCMSGNVSEWVKIDGKGNYNALGGNWSSDFEYLRIDSKLEFRNKTNASPFIGFRPVIIKN